MKSTLIAGIDATFTEKVSARYLVPALFPDDPVISSMPGALATAWLVALAERACVVALVPHLDAGEASVGTQMALQHMAPTPIGYHVTVDVQCAETEKRRSTWRFTIRDDKEVIATGEHTRFVVDAAKIADTLARKQSELSQGGD